MATHVKVAGTWRTTQSLGVKVSGTWRDVKQKYVKVSGTWKEVFTAYTYKWVIGSWGGCNATCGGGVQTRPVYCQRSDGTTVANSKCTGAKPASTQGCNTQSCTVCKFEKDVNIRYPLTGWSVHKDDSKDISIRLNIQYKKIEGTSRIIGGEIVEIVFTDHPFNNFDCGKRRVKEYTHYYRKYHIRTAMRPLTKLSYNCRYTDSSFLFERGAKKDYASTSKVTAYELCRTPQ